MPCDTMRNPQQTEEQRKREVEQALADLQKQIASGMVQVVIGESGAICFSGWSEDSRRKVTDVCAYHALAQRDSWELRQAIARAEMLSGRKLNKQAIGAGFHSHDGGQTWSTH